MRRLVPLSFVLLSTLALAACGGGAPSSPAGGAASQPPASTAAACGPSTDGAAVEVEIAGNAFEPQAVQAAVGDVISWTNADGVPHSAVVESGGCATETLRQGDSGALVFSAPGTYSYVCGIHPSMTGTIEISG